MRAATRSSQAGDVAYLFLPLAHAFALLIQLAILDLGATIAYFGGDPKQIIPELSEVQPTYLPSVPRIFEKLYTLVTAHGDVEQIKGGDAGRAEGARRCRPPGQEVPPELQAHFDGADEQLFKNVRAAFGGRLRQASRAPRRSRRRSSSSSTPAACRCSRATA